MKWFALHIIIKDCSFLICYFLLLRFNLTNETFLPEMVSNFPGASRLSLSEMLGAALFYNLIPFIVSFITYGIIVFAVHKIFKVVTTTSLIITGVLLFSTTPLVFIMFEGLNMKYKANWWALIISLIVSIATYYFFNRKSKGLRFGLNNTSM
jgi:hypothetical protein